jgi:hypothetical protein
MFHRRITDILNRDAVVADGRAFAAKFPELALLVRTVAINEQITDPKIFHRRLRMIDRLAHDDDGTVGIVRQHQNCRHTRTAQGLRIAPQNNGLVNLEFSRRQHHFTAAGRQSVERGLDSNIRNAGAQSDHGRCGNRRWRGGHTQQRGRAKAKAIAATFPGEPVPTV